MIGRSSRASIAHQLSTYVYTYIYIHKFSSILRRWLSPSHQSPQDPWPGNTTLWTTYSRIQKHRLKQFEIRGQNIQLLTFNTGTFWEHLQQICIHCQGRGNLHERNWGSGRPVSILPGFFEDQCHMNSKAFSILPQQKTGLHTRPQLRGNLTIKSWG